MFDRIIKIKINGQNLIIVSCLNLKKVWKENKPSICEFTRKKQILSLKII